MNPLNYIETVRDSTLDAIVSNEDAITKLIEELTTAQERKAILADSLSNCETIINILSHETPTA